VLEHRPGPSPDGVTSNDNPHIRRTTADPARSLRAGRGQWPHRASAWLIARLVRQEPVRYKEFKERFGRPGRSFCCEVAALREAGIIRGSELLERRHRSDAR
jgi:hypothetical protein